MSFKILFVDQNLFVYNFVELRTLSTSCAETRVENVLPPGLQHENMPIEKSLSLSLSKKKTT